MDQERSIRRARRNRTCFSKYQVTTGAHASNCLVPHHLLKLWVNFIIKPIETKFHSILCCLQLERLEEVFRESKYPDVYRREEIAAQLDIKEEVVRVSDEQTTLHTQIILIQP